MQSVSSNPALARWDEASARGLVRPVNGGNAQVSDPGRSAVTDSETRQAIHSLRLTLDRLPE